MLAFFVFKVSKKTQKKLDFKTFVWYNILRLINFLLRIQQAVVTYVCPNAKFL